MLGTETFEREEGQGPRPALSMGGGNCDRGTSCAQMVIGGAPGCEGGLYGRGFELQPPAS